MKKALGLVLAMTMALGLVACGTSSGGAASTTAGGDASTAAAEASTAAAEASTAAAEASTAAEAASAASEEASTAEAAPSAEGEIVIWHQYTEGQQEYITKVVEEFNAANPGMVVKEEYQPGSNSDFQDKVYQAVMAGNGPDMIIHYASEAAKYVADDKVADLSQYLSDATVSALPQSFYEEATSFADGKLHILPVVSSGPIFFYNKEVYDELGLSAPATWDDLVANCEAVKAAYPDMAGFAFDSEVDGASTLIMQTGNKLIDEDGIYFNTEEVAAQMKFYQDNIANGNFTNAKVGNYYSEDFNAGVLASYIGSVAGVPYLEKEFGTGPVPQGGAVKWTPAWNRGIIVFNYGDESRLQVAGAFADYFASPDVNAGFCIAANYPALFPETLNHPDYKAYEETVIGWDQLHPEYAGALPAVTAYAYTRTALGTLMSEVAGGVDVNEALTTAVEYIESELASE